MFVSVYIMTVLIFVCDSHLWQYRASVTTPPPPSPFPPLRWTKLPWGRRKTSPAWAWWLRWSLTAAATALWAPWSEGCRVETRAPYPVSVVPGSNPTCCLVLTGTCDWLARVVATATQVKHGDTQRLVCGRGDVILSRVLDEHLQRSSVFFFCFMC